MAAVMAAKPVPVPSSITRFRLQYDGVSVSMYLQTWPEAGRKIGVDSCKAIQRVELSWLSEQRFDVCHLIIGHVRDTAGVGWHLILV